MFIESLLSVKQENTSSFSEENAIGKTLSSVHSGSWTTSLQGCFGYEGAMVSTVSPDKS